MQRHTSYTIGELVEKLQLPRSTVVGWLKRYEHYIDFEMQGKRRVYLESSLTILREIAKLREQDISLLKIDDELAQRHPIQAQPAPESVEKSTGAEQADRESDMTSSAHLPTVNSKNDEISALFGRKIDEISQYIASEQQQRQSLVTRMRRWYLSAVILLLLLLLLFIGAVIAVQQTLYEHKSELIDNRKLLQSQSSTLLQQLEDNKISLKKARERIRQQTAELNQIGIKLDHSAADYQKNIAILKAGLDEQRRQFAVMLQKTLKDAEAAKSRELAKQRDAFAKQQLKKLQKLGAMMEQIKQQRQQIELLKMRLTAKQASLDEVMRRAAMKNKTVKKGKKVASASVKKAIQRKGIKRKSRKSAQVKAQTETAKPATVQIKKRNSAVKSSLTAGKNK